MTEGDKQFKNQAEIVDSDMDNFYNLSPNSSIYTDKRSVGEKIIITIIVLVSFSAIFFGYLQFSNVIKKPFISLLGGQRSNQNTCVNGDCNLQNEILATLAQQQKDTDKDGLSDYDELNVYGTSPFLEDSDSDGFNDKQEIDGGYDPNCPGNDNCFTSSGIASNYNSSDDQLAQNLLAGNADADTLRSLLVQQGFPQETLNAISDEQLLATYQQALSGDSQFNSSAVLGDSSGGSLGGVDLTSINSLKNLTGAQIRELMISRGAPADVLSQVGDDQLRDMFLSQLNSQAN